MATDWVDGYVARRTGQVSELGKVLDPVADRLAIAAGLIALVVRGVFPLWAALLILVRDVAVLVAGAALLCATGHPHRRPVDRQGRDVLADGGDPWIAVGQRSDCRSARRPGRRLGRVRGRHRRVLRRRRRSTRATSATRSLREACSRDDAAHRQCAGCRDDGKEEAVEFPEDLRYTKEHEWARGGRRVRVGITDFAQDALGDVVYVDLPEVGRAGRRPSQPFGEVESTKSVSDVFSPVTGTIVGAEPAAGGAARARERAAVRRRMARRDRAVRPAQLDGAPGRRGATGARLRRLSGAWRPSTRPSTRLERQVEG